MTFKIDGTLLAATLSRARHAIDTKPSTAILSGALVEIKDGTARVSTTNLDIRVSSHVAAEGDDGRIVLDFAKLNAIVNSMPAGEIGFKVCKSYVEMTCGTFRATLAFMDAKDWPDGLNIKGAFATREMDAADIVRPLAFCRHAFTPQNNPVQNNCKGAIVELGESVFTCVGTDARRMAVYGPVKAEKGVKPVTIPTRVVNAVIDMVKGTDGTWTMAVSDEMVSVVSEDGSVSISGKLVCARPPLWRQVVMDDRKLPIRITANRSDLLNEIERASTTMIDIADSKAIAICAKDGRMTLDGRDSRSSTHAELPVTISGGKIDGMMINPNFLIESLQSFADDEIAICATNEHNPVCIVGENAREIVMPLREV